MTLLDKTKADTIIRMIAKREKKRPNEIRQAMQEALDAAWAAASEPGSLRARAAWLCLFPDGKKPTVEEFVCVCAQSAKERL